MRRTVFGGGCGIFIACYIFLFISYAEISIYLFFLPLLLLIIYFIFFHKPGQKKPARTPRTKQSTKRAKSPKKIVSPQQEPEPLLHPMHAEILKRSQEMPHLQFLGIDITGTPRSFGQQLIRLGYHHQGYHKYIGPFTGIEGSAITFHYDTRLQFLYQVDVLLPFINCGGITKYRRLQEELARKYGQPSSVSEDLGRYTQADDSIKESIITRSQMKLVTHYTTPLGSITLTLLDLGIQLCYANTASQQLIQDIRLEHEIQSEQHDL